GGPQLAVGGSRLPEPEPTCGDGYPLRGLAAAGEPRGEREEAEHPGGGQPEEPWPSEAAADPELDDGGHHDSVEGDEGEGGPRRVPLRECEREPDSTGVHSPPTKLGGGQREPLCGRRWEHVAQTCENEADADSRAAGHSGLRTNEAVNQQAEEQEARTLARNADGGPAELRRGQRAHGLRAT